MKLCKHPWQNEIRSFGELWCPDVDTTGHLFSDNANLLTHHNAVTYGFVRFVFDHPLYGTCTGQASAFRGTSQCKDGLFSCGGFHYKFKTVMRPSYFHNGNSYTGVVTFYIETGPWSTVSLQTLYTFLEVKVALRKWHVWISLYNAPRDATSQDMTSQSIWWSLEWIRNDIHFSRRSLKRHNYVVLGFDVMSEYHFESNCIFYFGIIGIIFWRLLSSSGMSIWLMF